MAGIDSMDMRGVGLGLGLNTGPAQDSDGPVIPIPSSVLVSEGDDQVMLSEGGHYLVAEKAPEDPPPEDPPPAL